MTPLPGGFQIPIFLLVLHFIADFVLQTDWMALNKSKRWDALALHVSMYTATFGAALGFAGTAGVTMRMPATFLVLTWATHFLTDALTSRATSRLWAANERHWFFVMIGFDQLIHAATLALTWRLTQ